MRTASAVVCLALLVGIAALALLGTTPYLGGLVKALVVLMGVGVYARALKGLIVEMRAGTA